MKPILQYAIKLPNKRIWVLVNHTAEGPDVIIHTKRLVGTWKERNIRESAVRYGWQTFECLSEIFRLIGEDPYYRRSLNPHTKVKPKVGISISKPGQFPTLDPPTP